jgi:hypothetical protein
VQDHIKSIVEQYGEGLITMSQCIHAMFGSGVETIVEAEALLAMSADQIAIELANEPTEDDDQMRNLQERAWSIVVG